MCLADASHLFGDELECLDGSHTALAEELTTAEDREVFVGVADWTFGGTWTNVTGIAAQTAVDARAGERERVTLSFVQEGPCERLEADRAQVLLWLEGVSGSFALEAESVQTAECPATLEE